jgi:hypothetical protein
MIEGLDISTVPKNGTRVKVRFSPKYLSSGEIKFYLIDKDGWADDWYYAQDQMRPYVGGKIMPVFICPVAWMPRNNEV